MLKVPDSHKQHRHRIPRPPKGWARIGWLGPGFLWMVSATGSGELLFTPRIAAQYGYTLLWALLAAVILKWFVNREIGRYAVCTGLPVLDGFASLRGPRQWAVWLILVPQLIVAVATTAGLASAAATAVVLVLPGPAWLWTTVILVVSVSILMAGPYSRVERIATVIGIVLAIAVVAAAASVFPGVAPIASGFVPRLNQEWKVEEVLPWLGFMLSGAAGLIWYSYWMTAKGYGAAGNGDRKNPPDVNRLTDEDRSRLKSWLRQMLLDNSVAVIGVLMVVLAFLILGAELLLPKKLVPEEDKVAETLGQLLGGVWGKAGYWFMVACVLVGFWGTLLSGQDGWARMYAHGILLIRGVKAEDRTRLEGWWRKFFLATLLGVCPLVLYFIFGEPVGLLKVSGVIEAAHIPIVTILVLLLNRSQLPKDLRPGWPVVAMNIVSAVFFGLFALVYVWQLVT